MANGGVAVSIGGCPVAVVVFLSDLVVGGYYSFFRVRFGFSMGRAFIVNFGCF